MLHVCYAWGNAEQIHYAFAIIFNSVKLISFGVSPLKRNLASKHHYYLRNAAFRRSLYRVGLTTFGYIMSSDDDSLAGHYLCKRGAVVNIEDGNIWPLGHVTEVDGIVISLK